MKLARSAILALWLAACGLTSQEVKTIEKDALTVTQIGCVMASKLTDAKALAIACGIDNALVPLVSDLIGQREGARKAGVEWTSH